MRSGKLYPIDGGERWGAPWYDATGKRRAVTAATPEEKDQGLDLAVLDQFMERVQVIDPSPSGWKRRHTSRW